MEKSDIKIILLSLTAVRKSNLLHLIVYENIMRTLIVIPARYMSKRFEGKPLALIQDKIGIKKTLIERTWESAKKVKKIEKIIVATDDERIEKECKRFGAEVVRTSQSCKNGTERVLETIKILKENYDVIINFQGDSPLIDSEYVESILNAMNDKTVKIATPVLEINKTLFGQIKKDRIGEIVGSTSVVFKKNFDALYFSKSFIPLKIADAKFKRKCYYFHIGLYAYRASALESYTHFGEGRLENIEGLEQLRFLENDLPIKCVPVRRKKQGFWEVNNLSDVEVLEKILASGSF